MSKKTGASLQMLDSLSVNLLKAWWRAEAFLERWKRTVETEDYDPSLPPDVPRPGRGPCQVIVYGDAGKRVKPLQAIIGLTIGILIGFIAGSSWGRMQETAQGKLEERVRSLESRITE